MGNSLKITTEQDMGDANTQTFAPVVLFVYSRLEHTKRTIEALIRNKEAVETELYVFCDAPNPKATDEQLAEIHATHKYLQSLDSGFARINLEISKEHRGAGRAIIRGISIVLAKHGRCIILENDMEVEPLFLEYMNKGLEAYKDDKKIYGIASTSYNIKLPWWYRKDLYLLPRTESWGWATWADRWKDVDWEVRDFEDLENNKRLQAKFNKGGSDLYCMLKEQMEGITDTWDIQWEWHVFKHKGYFVHSRWCFQYNNGFDGSGAHCGTNNQIQQYFAPIYSKSSLDVNYTSLRPHCVIINKYRHFYNKYISFVREVTIKRRVKALIKKLNKIMRQ